MFPWKNTSRETHYHTLSVEEDANLEEIRSNYRSALLACHPDKLQTPRQSDVGDRFLKVQQAWEILGNPKLRAAYDNELRASRQDLGVAEELSLEDMTIEDDAQVLILCYQCRCGDYFSVDSSELEKMGYKVSREEKELWFETPEDLPASVVIPCGSCSLQVRLLIITDIKLPIHDHS
ncbi:hypothetical protein K2173_027996 [Erythroxylum novogranatense]|uniref:DPH4 homolog n=1 Tax=Erythroxylum novogranatense TaxID=1862640 RepID=A0AAV8U3K1_9ROSI|nr:hypothetical protein K2173_027996 [Erythroxylum novogranatense]